MILNRIFTTYTFRFMFVYVAVCVRRVRGRRTVGPDWTSAVNGGWFPPTLGDTLSERSLASEISPEVRLAVYLMLEHFTTVQ